MAADQTLTLEKVSALGFLPAVVPVELGTIALSLVHVSAKGPSGSGSSAPSRPSSGFLYPRGDY